MAERLRGLSVSDIVAILALIGGSITAGLPATALTRSLTLLFALGGAIYLCHKLFASRWKKRSAVSIAAIVYIAVVLLLFEQEARAAKTVSPVATIGLVFWNLIFRHLSEWPWAWIIGSLIIGFLLGLLTGVSRKRRPKSCRSAFRAAYKNYRDKLGDLKKDEVIRSVYQAWHENAIVIWIEGESDTYLLAYDGGFRIFPDPIVDDNAWRYDEENRKLFNTPQGLDPPWGFVAKGWKQNPDAWKWIGWRVAHCFYQVYVVRVQTFARGTIIGGLRPRPQTPSGEIEYRTPVYVFLDDEKVWQREFCSDKPPSCVEPPMTEQEVMDFYEKWKDK